MWALALNWMLKDPVKTAALVACFAFAGIAAWRGHELRLAHAHLYAYEVERDVLRAVANQRAAEVEAQNRSARAAVQAAAQLQEKRDVETTAWERRVAARDRDLWLCRRAPGGTTADVPRVPDDPAGEAGPYRPVTDGPVGSDIGELIADGERYRTGLAQCYATLDANR